MATFVPLEARRAHATAWLAPLPPNPVEKEFEVRVSPGPGTRGVRVMKSMLREPITAMELEGMTLLVRIFAAVMFFLCLFFSVFWSLLMPLPL
jgi:hypothetical protein